MSAAITAFSQPSAPSAIINTSKPSSNVNVDTIQPAERDVLSLKHSQESLNKLCDALTPFGPIVRHAREGFRGEDLKSALVVRAALVAGIYYPTLIVPGVLTAIAYAMRLERTKRERAKSRARGEDTSKLIEDEKLTITPRDVTVTAEALATAFERFASVAEWRSRVVSSATVYFAIVMSMLSLMVPAQTMMVWLALYITRPASMRVVPDPFVAAWTRLPNNARSATNIQ